MSQGGFLSLRAALRHPDRVRALVLIDSRVDVDPPEVLEGYRGMVNHWLTPEPLGEVGQMVAGLILGDPQPSATWIERWEQRRGPHMEYTAGALLDRDDISDRVAELTMPILSVHGEDDQAIVIGIAEAFQAQVVDGRGLVRVPGDAGLEMYLGELATIRDLGLGLPIVVFVDHQLGLIELKQRASGRANLAVDFGPTEFPRVADALGGEGETVTGRRQLRSALHAAFERDTFT